jgi:hypothetical protein
MAEVAGMTGREILQAIIDGKLPQAPISETMSFWINILADTPSASRHVRDRSAMIARYFAPAAPKFPSHEKRIRGSAGAVRRHASTN